MRNLRRKIEWHPPNYNLSQVYSTGLEYALCTSDFKQHLPWVFCKDFIHDAVFGAMNQEKINIYGYIYDPKSQPPPHLRRMRLLVTNKSDKEFGKKVTASVDFVNQIERRLEMPSLSRVYTCQEPPARYATCGVYLFSGSGKWFLSPPLISLYTLIVRSGFVHTVGADYNETIDKIVGGKVPGYQTNDRLQLTEARPGIERIIQQGYRKIFGDVMENNYPRKLNNSTMHNHFGIVSFTKELSKSHAPHWFSMAR